MTQPIYAHTLPGKPPGEWEPLFTPFGDTEEECRRETCEKCRQLEPNHGHLNKVAWWTAKFASEMFAADSTEAKSAREWGYLTDMDSTRRTAAVKPSRPSRKITRSSFSPATLNTQASCRVMPVRKACN